MKIDYVECVCHADEHLLRFIHDKEEGEVVMCVFLNHYDSWYKRLYRAVKYVFGYKCKYGHFDCTILDKERIEQLKKILSEVE